MLALRPPILLPVLLAAFAVAAGAAPATAPALPLPVTVPPTGPAMAGAPTVSAGSDSALVSASVTPGSIGMTWSVQYGTTDGYGAATQPEPLAPGTEPVAVSTSLGSLAADATYHYRFALATVMATTYTADATFATTSAIVTLTDPDPVVDPDPPAATEAEGQEDAPSAAVAQVVPPAATAATTTTATTPTAPPKTPKTPTRPTLTLAPDTAVSARLTAATATRTAVRLTLKTTEPTTVRVTLKPSGNPRATTTKTYRSLKPGAHPFTIHARLRTALTVTITATDRAGNTLTITRRLKPHLPAASRRA